MSDLYSTEAEEALIGYVLINPERFSKIKINLDDFQIHQHRWIWNAMDRMIKAGVGVDNITLADQLESDGHLVEIGGLAYLTRLMSLDTNYIGNPSDYARIVKKNTNQKKRIELASQVAKGQNLDKIAASLQDLEVTPPDPWQPFTLADAYQERPPVEYIVQGLFPLPSMTIVYGSPGTLKSLLLADLSVCVAAGKEWLPPAYWIAGNLAKPFPTQQHPVMWCDFDNGQRRTHDRIGALARARDLSPNTPITYYSMPYPWLDGSSTSSVSGLSQRAQAIGAKLIVIDNLGVVKGSAEENSAEMAQVMSLFRQLAEETGAAVILIHHQRKSNGTTGRAGDTLRGHSSIEASLDLALLVEREERSDLISIKSTKTRGVDVLPFSAVFTYENNPTGDLATAKFWGIISEDNQSNLAIQREIKVALFSTVMGKTDLAKAVKSTLETVGLNRIRDIIERMAISGDIRITGQGKEKLCALP